MTKRELVARIVAEPDDVALRRVYADYLLALGDPLGEFVLIDLELEGSEGPHRAALLSRREALLAQYFTHWTQVVAAPRERVGFTRGFVERWSCDPHTFLSRARRVARVTPLRCAVLEPVRWQDLLALLKHDVTLGLPELELRGLNRWPFAALAGHDFRRLRRLVLAGMPPGRSHSLLGLVSRSWFAKVEELGLDLPLSTEETGVLEDTPVLRQLVALEVRTTVPVGHAPRLERLCVSAVGSDDARLPELLRQAPRLKTLRLSRCGLGAPLARALREAPAVKVELNECYGWLEEPPPVSTVALPLPEKPPSEEQAAVVGRRARLIDGIARSIARRLWESPRRR